MFDAVLVANRGEIAIRVVRACRELGVRAVAVYSDADRDAAHVRLAHEAYRIGPTPPAASYLDVDRIVEVARRSGVDAIHPGYGFLAENAEFAEAVTRAGLVFVGPGAEAIRRMGDKLSARQVATDAGVPVVPGTADPTDDVEAALEFGESHGYPVAVKAMFGGGGRGMKVVRDPEQMNDALESARREAVASFGRGECYLERYLEHPRHVEVQILADLDGSVVHLGDRDCSLQRRHQKLVEEAPAPALDPEVRDAMARAAVAIAREMSYTNAGTCEFLVETGKDGTTRFYFLEMNTRLQVEHPVTELVTGVDLVHAQLRIASGDGMGFGQEDVTVSGHAIEVRVNAEDPSAGFVPAPGTVTRLRAPDGPWVRFDSAITDAGVIPDAYDSLIAKLVVWATDRDMARARMTRALDELEIIGVPTTAGFHRLAMRHEQFASASHATVSVEHEWDLTSLERTDTAGTGPPGGSDDTAGRDVVVEVEDRRFTVRVFDPEDEVAPAGPRRRSRSSGPAAGAASGSDLVAPMQGTVIAYQVTEGAAVSEGDVIVVLEAMKMENPVRAHRDGVVSSVEFDAGDVVAAGALLAKIEDA